MRVTVQLGLGLNIAVPVDHGPLMLQVWVKAIFPTVSQLHVGRIASQQPSSSETRQAIRSEDIALSLFNPFRCLLRFSKSLGHTRYE